MMNSGLHVRDAAWLAHRPEPAPEEDESEDVNRGGIRNAGSDQRPINMGTGARMRVCVAAVGGGRC